MIANIYTCMDIILLPPRRIQTSIYRKIECNNIIQSNLLITLLYLKIAKYVLNNTYKANKYDFKCNNDKMKFKPFPIVLSII